MILKIRGCNGCPLGSFDYVSEFIVCKHPSEKNLIVGEFDDFNSLCPLRKEPLVIELDEERDNGRK